MFWRGADTGYSFYVDEVWADLPNYYPRNYLVQLSAENPEIIDAKFTGEKMRDHSRDDLGMRDYSGPWVPIGEHMLYRWLLSVDGWTAAWLRPAWIMASNSVLLMQETNKIEWFYYRLEPKVHYYPVANNLSDLL